MTGTVQRKTDRRFGDNLDLYMRATHNEITPNKLAQKTGIDYFRIKRMLANAALPTAGEFKKILEVFGNKPSDWTYGMSEEASREFVRATSNATIRDYNSYGTEPVFKDYGLVTDIGEESPEEAVKAIQEEPEAKEEKAGRFLVKLTPELKAKIEELEPLYQSGEIQLGEYIRRMGMDVENTSKGILRARLLKLRKQAGIDTSVTYGPRMLEARNSEKAKAKLTTAKTNTKSSAKAAKIENKEKLTTVNIPEDKVLKMYSKLKEIDKLQIRDLIVSKFIEEI